MRLGFLELPVGERQLYFQQAAAQRGLHPAIMEKDFWVCWLLGTLFADPGVKDAVVFKGGTSLSKVHGAIQRFSEDIDLSVSPTFLGVGEDELKVSDSKGEHKRWMAKLQSLCEAAVQEQFQPLLERVASDVLGSRPGTQPWLQYQLDEATQSPVLLFHYPSQQAAGFSYLQRSVKLEFGSLTDQRPVGQTTIHPWIAEQLPQAFPDWHCQVVALDVQRTFWEKATILHAEHHRAAELRMRPRYSRHYADTAALANHPVVGHAIADAELRDRVVVWKSRFFPSGSAHYELAKPGTFRLVPPTARLAELEEDYRAMQPMYFATPTPFETVLEVLSRLEAAINKPGS